MLEFTNFIRDCGEILADGGIAMILDSTLYDLESVYNQAFQEFQTLSPVQVSFLLFSKFTSRNKTQFILRGRRNKTRRRKK